MSESQPSSTLSLQAICGIIGPISYAIVLVILGLVRPGYNHVTQFMSELSEVGSPNAILMNTAGFPLLGLLMIAFAFGLHRGLIEGGGSKVGPALIAVSSAGLVGAVIFPCDPGRVNVSFASVMHDVTAMIAAFAMIFAPLVISQRLKRDSLWQSYRSYSLITGVVAAIIVTMMGFTIFEPWKGALQRASMGVPLLWIEIMAIKLLRLSIRSSA